MDLSKGPTPTGLKTQGPILMVKTKTILGMFLGVNLCDIFRLYFPVNLRLLNKYVWSTDYFLEHVGMALMGKWPPHYPDVHGSNLSAGNLKKSGQKIHACSKKPVKQEKLEEPIKVLCYLDH